MKTPMILLVGLLTTAVTVKAQVVLSMPFSLTATVVTQNENSTNNGTTTIVSPPIKTSGTVASLLPLLAQAEFTAGNYPTNQFPVGAKLALVFYPTNFNQSYFKVTDSAGNLLVNVNDIMQIQINGSGVVSAGKTVNATGLISGKSTYVLVKITYDDTGKFGGDLTFDFAGVLQALGNDTVISAAGHTYKESWNLKIIDGTGEGVHDIDDFVIYGSAAAIGSGNFVF